jgi:hypothetical protein
MMVYLVPVGRRHHELYSESPEETPAPRPDAGRLQRWADQANVQWHALVEQARRRTGSSRLAKWRDALVCRLAESIAEQRTLWALRTCVSARLVHSTSLNVDRARAELMRIVAAARRHHGRWLIVDGLLFVLCGVLALVPGPNLLAYYFLFRLIGHLQSWRGARQADRLTWTFDADDSLAELETLIEVPRAERASRVAAIAARLNIPRLSSFFERTAVPSS